MRRSRYLSTSDDAGLRVLQRAPRRRVGLPFAFGHYFSARNTVPALDLYRESFSPSRVLDEPYAMIGVSALATEDEKEACRQVMAHTLTMVRLRTRRPGLVPTPEEAEAYEFSPMERELVDGWNTNVRGTPDQVRSGLDELQKRTGADELMITAFAYSADVRAHPYELIADAYGLPEA